MPLNKETKPNQRLLLGKYHWERHAPPYPPSYGLNITTTVLLGEYLLLPPTRHDLTQGQKPEGRLKWG